MIFPSAFETEMTRILGEDGFNDYLKSFDKPRVYGLRVNTSKISVEDFLRISPFELKPIPWIPNGFYYDGDTVSPAKHPYYYAGLYYLQEPSAMTPANLMPVEHGDRILDICAAPGGKSTELGAKLKSADMLHPEDKSGLLVSNDISSTRARALLKNLEVFGIGSCMVTCEEPAVLSERFPGFFNKILIDAPCSGEGMFRKEHKMIRAWEEHGPQYFGKIQRSIINEAANMLDHGGIIIYSTCTFSVYENEGTISDFLNSHPDFHVVDVKTLSYGDYEGFRQGLPGLYEGCPEEVSGAIRIWPQHMDGEGHFICVLKKNDINKSYDSSTDSPISEAGKCRSLNRQFNESAVNNNSSSSKDKAKTGKKPTDKQSNSKKQNSININDTALSVLINEVTARDHYLADPHNEQLFFIPDYLPSLKKIRFLRSGLYAGDIKKDRFEPSQALAMTLTRDDYKYTLDLDADDIRVIKYLKGETIESNDLIGNGKGYVLILLEGHPLGWARANGTLLKNKYLPGWRIMW